MERTLELDRTEGLADEELSAPAARVLHRHIVNPPKTWFDKIEAFVSSLSVRDTFWHRICSLIWLPLAFFSGIRMKALDANTYQAYLPFSRFNRNWYRAMAGGALLANSEIAGGMYVFGVCGADYTVVCKHLEYRFLRPCLGPALYKMTPRENIREMLETKQEFNITMDMDIHEQVARGPVQERRVGRCTATFHVTPKVHHKMRKARQKAHRADAAAAARNSA